MHSMYLAGVPVPTSMLRQPIHFAPGAIPAGPVPEALRLLEQAETRRAQLRTAETEQIPARNVPTVAKS